MIKSIHFKHYKKLKDITLNFSKKVNVISGTNGTCKSTVLYLISNSYQKITPRSISSHKFTGITPEQLKLINSLNALVNPKIESLAKGDKKYNNPAPDTQGNLFIVDYYDDTSINFRKHNSRTDDGHRYRIIPKYSSPGESLPFQPVIYLGLSRLIPTGETNDEVKKVRQTLPSEYENELIKIYKELTGIEISNIDSQEINDVKKRLDFNTAIKGVDSNTISAGEDNILIIILSLLSLKYYNQESSMSSVLLIDEIDATLHPSLQFKLLELINKFSTDYKIQVFFTTHSLYLLEKAFNCKNNIMYLTSLRTKVQPMENPDIYKIRLYLNQEQRLAIFSNQIPIVSEDQEARWFIDRLLNYLASKKPEFSGVRNYFKNVEISMGKDQLKSLFKEPFFRENSLRSICVLDGDAGYDKSNKSRNIILLPGDVSPELMIFEYTDKLYTEEVSEFWWSDDIVRNGFNFEFYRDQLKPLVDEQINNYDREKAKDLLNDNIDFFDIVLMQWLSNPDNQSDIYRFYKDLNEQFRKVAYFHGINKDEWSYGQEK